MKNNLFMNHLHLETITKKVIGIPPEFSNQIYLIEKSAFGNKYDRCPRSLEEFEYRHLGKETFLVLCQVNNDIVGCRVFEKFDNSHIESVFMSVLEPYRGIGISNLICAISVHFLKWYGFKYISSWTHVNISASKILTKYAPYISTDPFLSRLELKLLNNSERAMGKEIGSLGNERTKKDFFKMLDGGNGDANYWVHLL